MRVNVIWRWFWNHLPALVFVVLSVAIQSGCNNPETTLFIQKPTEVLSINPISSASPPSSDEASEAKFEPGKVMIVLKPGETVKAIGVYHGKEYDAFHVKLADGTEGLIVAGDTFTAASP